jgi:hypothetical protein
MNKVMVLFRAGMLLVLCALLLAVSGTAQTTRPPVTGKPATPAVVAKFEVLAETKLLMEGLAHPNYRSLQKLLKTKPPDTETWVFIRGQSLLVAETGNLLLLRPPRNSGRDTWMKLAMEMRTKAGDVARRAAARDHGNAKKALEVLTTSCNRCHQTFRVPVKVGPDMEKEDQSDTE